MHRRFLLGLLVAACASLVFVPAALAGKLAIKTVTVTSLGLDGGNCGFNLSIHYAGGALNGGVAHASMMRDGFSVGTASAGITRYSDGVGALISPLDVPATSLTAGTYNVYVSQENKRGVITGGSVYTSDFTVSTSGVCPAALSDVSFYPVPAA